MSLLLASDLDRTLIYSPSALRLGGTDEDAPALACVEVIDGKPHSFLELTALQRLSRLAGEAVFVPVTTRTVAQFRRVRFPDVPHKYAVTANGGTILIDGVVDQEWKTAVAERISAEGMPLSELIREQADRTRGEWVLKRRIADGLFSTLVVDIAAMPASFLDDWRTWCLGRGWQVSMQGRKIYTLPRSLTKEAALAEVARREGAAGWLAAGDGVLDAGFLAAAVASFRPPHGELHDLGWTHPTVTVGPRPGVRAAGDIIRFFEDRLRQD